MGIIRSNAAFLLAARARGVEFGRTLTLGRQRLYVRPSELERLINTYRPDLRGNTGDLQYGDAADGFFHHVLGVHELQTLDHSAYEGATLTHDLNQPLPADLHEQFDTVIDSGTLEHVFNLPTAIASCMQLLKRGGTLFVSSPANNLCGHGFYQFSPELWFRLLKNANGFSLERMVLVTHPFPGAELSPHQTWYDVSDPAEIGARVPLMTSSPAFLMVEATRTAIVPVLAAPPLQSDYVARWRDPETTSRARGAVGGLRAIYRRLPARVQAFVAGTYQRRIWCTLRNRRAFRRL